MFAIRLLPPTQIGFDGQRLGEIVVGDFQEVFPCHSDDLAGLEDRWRERLRSLIEGDSVIILQHDPRFAWVVYRDGGDCHIQERLSIDGSFANLTPRVTRTEDGRRVSEWTTTVTAIRQFLDAEPGATADGGR
jgi:hypothetical protein